MGITIDEYLSEIGGHIYSCPDCWETFDIQVWHCPYCEHHWPIEMTDCSNCYIGKLSRSHRAHKMSEGLSRIYLTRLFRKEETK